jgi:SAM-dependent methyltransferase
MFGATIDYWLLRPLAHGRNRATEEELDARAESVVFDPQIARRRLDKLVARFEGHFRIDPKLSYLDVGCGRGDLALAFVQAGATDVTGIDVSRRNVEAARATTARMNGQYRPNFICADINKWQSDRKYDVVISHEALEHINDPDKFIKSLAHLLQPDGVAFLAFGPLFHSPVGDHLDEFFRIALPWRGVLFSEAALLKLREELFRPGDPVERFQDVLTGLNLMRFSEFLRYVDDADFDLRFMNVNPQLKSLPPAHWVSQILIRSPLRDYFAISVYAMLSHRGNGT